MGGIGNPAAGVEDAAAAAACAPFDFHVPAAYCSAPEPFPHPDDGYQP
jgi:hypothetical protein